MKALLLAAVAALMLSGCKNYALAPFGSHRIVQDKDGNDIILGVDHACWKHKIAYENGEKFVMHVPKKARWRGGAHLESWC